jgi:hypothetical protein
LWAVFLWGSFCLKSVKKPSLGQQHRLIQAAINQYPKSHLEIQDRHQKHYDGQLENKAYHQQSD